MRVVWLIAVIGLTNGGWVKTENKECKDVSDATLVYHASKGPGSGTWAPATDNSEFGWNSKVTLKECKRLCNKFYQLCTHIMWAKTDSDQYCRTEDGVKYCQCRWQTVAGFGNLQTSCATPYKDNTHFDIYERKINQTENCKHHEHAVEGVCTPCPPGTGWPYDSNPDQYPNWNCNPHYCEKNQHVVDGKCVACPTGKVRETFTAIYGNTECYAPATYYCGRNEWSNGQTCMACPTGTEWPYDKTPVTMSWTCDKVYCKGNQRVVSRNCVDCESRLVPPHNDTMRTGGPARWAGGPDSQCADYGTFKCDFNQWSSGSTRVCLPCPVGQSWGYQIDVNRIDLPNGWTCQVNGDRRCSGSQHVYHHHCFSCPKGYTNKMTSGSDNEPSGSDTLCTPIICKVNERVKNHECIPCGVQGYFNWAGGDDPRGADTQCHKGTDYCGRNFQARGGNCERCPTNTHWPHDHTLKSKDYSCVPLYCPRNYFFHNNACSKCWPFTTTLRPMNKATSCGAVTCSSKDLQFIEGSECKTCPTSDGYICDGTYKKVKMCGFHHKVLSTHECAACPKGEYSFKQEPATSSMETDCVVMSQAELMKKLSSPLSSVPTWDVHLTFTNLYNAVWWSKVYPHSSSEQAEATKARLVGALKQTVKPNVDATNPAQIMMDTKDKVATLKIRHFPSQQDANNFREAVDFDGAFARFLNDLEGKTIQFNVNVRNSRRNATKMYEDIDTQQCNDHTDLLKEYMHSDKDCCKSALQDLETRFNVNGCAHTTGRTVCCKTCTQNSTPQTTPAATSAPMSDAELAGIAAVAILGAILICYVSYVIFCKQETSLMSNEERKSFEKVKSEDPSDKKAVNSRQNSYKMNDADPNEV